MSSAGISFGGLASGLDTKAIISALVAIEERPIRALEAKKTSYTKQKSMFGDLKGLLEKLSTAAKALKTTTDFLQMKAASDDEDILKASASSTATPGTHRVKVMELAKAQISGSTGSPSATTSFGAPGAEFTISVGGNDYPIAVSGTPTLQSIADAINAEEDSLDFGVRAEVIDNGNTASGGANRYQLIIRSTETGPDGAFTLTPDSGSTEFTNLISQINSTPITTASQAQVEVNGISIFRSSNQISDLFAGVTLDLLSKNTAKEVTVTISTDSEATAKKVQEFTDAYNKVVDFFTEQNALDAEGKAKSPLFGDSTLRSMRTTLRGIVGGSVEGTGNTAFQLMSQLGITADTAGKLTFNRGKFDEALANDEQAAAAVFTQATNGIAGRMIDGLKVYTDSVEGLLKNRNDTFDRQVKDTQSRIDQAERRLTLFEQQLQNKYANLEQLLSRLQSQGSSVGNIGR